MKRMMLTRTTGAIRCACRNHHSHAVAVAAVTGAHTLSDAIDHSHTANALFATANAPVTVTNADNTR